MQQHPVPQNVTQYQFRLVGDMTLKQFLELLGGLVVAYLFYSSNLIKVVSLPLAGASLLGGIGLAFFPIEDRPLDQWIINFVKAIYAPTRYIWKKSRKIPNIFTFEPHPIAEIQVATKTVKAPSIHDLAPKAELDITDEERTRIQALDSMLTSMAPAKTATTSPQPVTPVTKPSLAPRRLKPLSQIQTNTIFESAPRPAPTPVTEKINLANSNLTTPVAPAVQVAKSTPKEEKTTSPVLETPAAPPTTTLRHVAPTSVPTNIKLPAPPSSPNLVVGMVTDQDGKIIENAIVSIVNDQGVPARAMKTNSLGQFYTSTPLGTGTYSLEVEKEGLSFPVNKLEVTGSLISPILLKAS